MKRIFKNKIWIGLLLMAVVFSACDSLLDAKSERNVFPEDHIINTTNNALYGTTGLFYELNKLADRYVLLGELRADLLSTTDNTRQDLLELSNFTYSADHPLFDTKDYYSVINNCNYIITTIDTSLIQSAEKILYREFAAAKAIRAWTYMQLALNFGTAKYYEEPILTLTHAKKDYPEYDIYELADLLIQDLSSWVDIELPENISMGEDVNSVELFFPVRFVLGELYLWKGEYENAARTFYDLIYENEYLITQSDQSRWYVENNAFLNSIVINWWSMFDFSELEVITMLAGSVEFGEGSLIDSLVNNYELMPSAPAVNNWESQTYHHNATLTKEGDLRGKYGSYEDYSDYTFSDGASHDELQIIKFLNLTTENSKAVLIYRVGLLYLRYAEAVNRAGKPNLAYATIKHGLSRSTMRIDTIVPPSEKYISMNEDSTYNLYDYVNFHDVIFDENIGVHERGCGQSHYSLQMAIPDLPSLEDSIEWVEDAIVLELALETAFEGNRFHDLMRIADRRNDPSYLATKVAAKHDDPATIQTFLEDRNNWYLPKSE